MEVEESGKNQRGTWPKRYLIDTHAQGRFTTITLLYLIIFSIILIFILLYPGLDQLVERGYASIEDNLTGERGFFIIDRFIPALLIYLILVGFHSIIMTHRIFGPMYRIEKRMIDAARGDLNSTIRFRKNDFLRGLDVTINSAFSSIGKRLDDVITKHDKLCDNLDQLVSALQSGKIPPQNVAVALKALQQSQESIHEDLKVFRRKPSEFERTSDLPTDQSIYL